MTSTPLQALGQLLGRTLIGALFVLAGWKTQWAAIVLIFYTLVLTALFHGLTGPGDPQFYLRLGHVGRNAGIIGGLLYLAVYGGGPLSVDGLRRGRR
ncbi:MAG: DoxX family protein [Burkholderiales bacterium]